jgi:hypothetical protein
LFTETSEFQLLQPSIESVLFEEGKKREELFESIETAATQIIKSNFYTGLVYLFCMLLVLTSFNEPRPKTQDFPVMIAVVE